MCSLFCFVLDGFGRMIVDKAGLLLTNGRKNTHSHTDTAHTAHTSAHTAHTSHTPADTHTFPHTSLIAAIGLAGIVWTLS